MADTPAFQSHHIIEQQVVEKSALIGKLQEFGLFNVNDTHNLLNMPADPEVAAKLGVSPHNGGPLKAYSDGLIAQLNTIQNSNVGRAAMAGELDARKIVVEQIYKLRDTMRAGLINGDLFTNTPKDMTTEIAKTKTVDFMGDLDGYSQKHADQIGKLAKGIGNEWDAITQTEARIKVALDAIEQDGVKAAKGSAEAAKNSLGVAIAQAREAGTLTLSEAFMKTLKDVSMKELKGVAIAGVAADIAISTAEAKTLAEKGDVAGAHSVMNALGARLAFGWLGAEMGAPAGPYGAVLGGLAGLLGGEALLKGIEKVANQLTGILNTNGTNTYVHKAPEATINPDGSTTITTFNPDNSMPSSNKTYDKDSKLTGETKLEYDALTNVKIHERIFNSDGKQTTIKTFDRTTGQQTSQTDFNADGTKTEHNFDPSNGNVTQEKRFDKDGNLTFDSVEEARKQAEAEKAEADRLVAADKLRADQDAQAAAMEEQHKKDEQNRLELENKQEEQRKKTEEAYNQQLEQNQQRAEEERKKIEAAKAEADANRLAAEKAEAKQKADKEKADADRPDKEKSGGEKTEAEQAEAEKAAAAKVEADRLAAEKAEADRLAAEQAAADKLRADQAAQAAAMEEQRKKDEQNRLEQEKQKKEDDDRKHAEELEKQKNDTINNINNGLNNSIKNPLGASGQQNFPHYQIPGPSLSPPPMNIPTYTNPNSDFSPFSSHGGGAPGVSTGFQNPPIPSSRPFTPSGGGGGVYIGSPVVLDLNHDGHLDIRPLDTQDKAAPKNETEHDLSENTKITPRFDWNADGTPDPTAWVGPQDGLLAIDLAKDGTAGSDGVIDQPKEIAFALWKTEDERVAELKAQGLDDKGIPVTDLEGLRWAFDSNHDNVLDMHDDRWNEFRVWQDANQNGITDAGELLTMDQAGIKLINLMPSSEGSKAFPDGSAITGTSTAQMTDGTKMLVGDVSLAYRPSLAG